MFDINNALAKSLGTKSFTTSMEDNAQVEVNFNIDTDAEGAPAQPPMDVNDSPAPEDNTSVEVSNAEEASTDVEQAESDVDELQQAQDSLESIRLEVKRQLDEEGGMSPQAYQFYRIAVESIIGSDALANVDMPSMESYGESRLRATVATLESHEALQARIEQVSMEGVSDWLGKIKYAIAKWWDAEKTLTNKAQALISIANTATGEHAASKSVILNGRKTPKAELLLTQPWQSDNEFLKSVENWANFYRNVSVPGNYTEDEVISGIFGTSQWKKVEGIPSYTIFGGKYTYEKESGVKFNPYNPNTAETSVPVLAPATCIRVLEQVVAAMSTKDPVKQNLENLVKLLDKRTKVEHTPRVQAREDGLMENVVDTKYHEPQDLATAVKTLKNAANSKIAVGQEILNYVQHCLNNREAVNDSNV